MRFSKYFWLKKLMDTASYILFFVMKLVFYLRSVTPAKMKIPGGVSSGGYIAWIPACAGMAAP
jgi:hypothetical protein